MESFFVGFDGFIDILYRAVKQRIDRTKYEPFTTLDEFGSYIKASSHKSCNVESVRFSTTLGGNAPLVSLGLASLSHPVHLVGCLGYPTIHPLFAELGNNLSSITSIGKAGTTSAYEFQDGKLMLGSMNDVLDISFPELMKRCPHLFTVLNDTSHFVTVNWTMCPLLQEFWKWLLEQPHTFLRNKSLFIDFADPKKRPKKDLVEALNILSALSERMPCSLGLNFSETTCIIEALGYTPHNTLTELGQQVTKICPQFSFYLHSSKEVVGISADAFESLPVPQINFPLRLTGAGDMFHAAILSALANKLPLTQRLQHAIAASNHWIRFGTPANHLDIQKFKTTHQQMGNTFFAP